MTLHALAEVYGVAADEDAEDVDWQRPAGERDWVVLMKDSRIRYRTVERDARLGSVVRAFCLASGNRRADEMVAAFVSKLGAIPERCATGTLPRLRVEGRSA